MTPLDDTITRKLGFAGNHQNLPYNMYWFILIEHEIVFKNLKIWKTASMEDDHNGRISKWKTTSMEDNVN